MKLLNTLKENFPHVAAASYDYLSEVNCSVAAFLVCSQTALMSLFWV